MYHPESDTGPGMVDSSGLSAVDVISASECEEEEMLVSTFVGVGIRGAGCELEVGRSTCEFGRLGWFIFFQET